jgi:nucleoside-diphosphate-sugar epimerase
VIIGITGSYGLLGSILTRALNHHIIIRFKGDIRKNKDIDKWLRNNNFDAIIHLAAIVSINKVNKDKRKAKIVNFYGTKKLIDCMNKNINKKKIWFFYASTSHVYNFSKKKISEKKKPDPISYYGKTKLLGENYIKKNSNKFNYCIGRIFSFTSKRQKKSYFIPNLVDKLNSSRRKIHFTNVNHYRDFLIDKDIVNGIKKLLIYRATGIYNICSGKKLNLIKLIKYLNITKNKKIIIEKNKNYTMLIGDNKKLKKLKWKPKKIKYLKYLHKKII